MKRSCLLLATLALMAGPALADDPAPADVLMKLHHSNQMEIEAGKLAQEKGQSKAVKDFGKMLVKDHTAADKQVKSLAKQMKVELPTHPPDMKDSKLEKARTLTGAEFDKAFAQAMVEDHKDDIEDVAEARDKTTDPQLKKLLTGIVPTLEKHQASAQKLVAQTESGAGTTGTGTKTAPGSGGKTTGTGTPGAGTETEPMQPKPAETPAK
jgi:putative membrane protein